jgi:hypothetical protein
MPPYDKLFNSVSLYSTHFHVFPHHPTHRLTLEHHVMHAYICSTIIMFKSIYVHFAITWYRKLSEYLHLKRSNEWNLSMEATEKRIKIQKKIDINFNVYSIWFIFASHFLWHTNLETNSIISILNWLRSGYVQHNGWDNRRVQAIWITRTTQKNRVCVWILFIHLNDNFFQL